MPTATNKRSASKRTAKKTAPASSPTQDALKIAQEKCGFDELRAGQEEALQAILSKRDTLVVQPTGSGKSAIYQIAGLMIEGTTIVVSPLIALQKDQVRAIADAELAEATIVNSTRKVSEIREAFDSIRQGSVEYVFLSPEQLQKQEVLEDLKAGNPSLFVVDEAHCISEWGHDFRPDYLRLKGVIETLGHPTVIAMTATASPEVRDDIIRHLDMKDPDVIVKGFDRPNIFLEVRTFDSEAAKINALLDEVDAAEKPGIVYVATRKHAEEIARGLEERNISAVHYHGGMRAAERDQIQNDFMAGNADVIVATNAFGMGVDKPNVRFVFHADVSDSLDSYYQEVGRAGRDGLPARATLFYRPENASVHRFLKGGGKVNTGDFEKVAEVVYREDEPVALEDLQKETGLSERKLVKAVNRLADVGAVEPAGDGTVAPADRAEEISQAAKEAAEEQERHREADRLRIEKMQAYAEMHSCRREYLLGYFGEDAPAHCDHCDNCKKAEKGAAGASTAPAVAPHTSRATAPAVPHLQAKKTQATDSPYPEKTRVIHSELGKGLVESIEGDKITVLFDDGGRKTLSLDFVKERGLLERAG